jgi:hypothetical protein
VQQNRLGLAETPSSLWAQYFWPSWELAECGLTGEDFDPLVERVAAFRPAAAVSPCAPSGLGIEPLATFRVGLESAPVGRDEQDGKRDGVGVVAARKVGWSPKIRVLSGATVGCISRFRAAARWYAEGWGSGASGSGPICSHAEWSVEPDRGRRGAGWLAASVHRPRHERWSVGQSGSFPCGPAPVVCGLRGAATRPIRPVPRGCWGALPGRRRVGRLRRARGRRCAK